MQEQAQDLTLIGAVVIAAGAIFGALLAIWFEHQREKRLRRGRFRRAMAALAGLYVGLTALAQQLRVQNRGWQQVLADLRAWLDRFAPRLDEAAATASELEVALSEEIHLLQLTLDVIASPLTPDRPKARGRIASALDDEAARAARIFNRLADEAYLPQGVIGEGLLKGSMSDVYNKLISPRSARSE